MKRYKVRCPYCSAISTPDNSFQGGVLVCTHCRRSFRLGPPPKEDSTESVAVSGPLPESANTAESAEFLLNAEKAKDETTGFTLSHTTPVEPGDRERFLPHSDKKRHLSDDFLELAGELLNIPKLKTPASVLASVPSGIPTPSAIFGPPREKTDRSAREGTDSVSDSGTSTTHGKSVDRVTVSRLETISRIVESEPKIDEAAASSKIWSVGQTLLGGKYQVVELSPGVPWAEGGVGIVHRVHHREWDIDFAVKSPKPDVILSETGKQSFERECQTWIELGLHTNIVTCYLVRRIGGIPRVFAEYVGDGTLRDWIVDGRLYEGGPTVALERILDIAIQFARGLEYAHQQGLLHLDVKPGNVMMSGMTAKVTDFGLAKIVTPDPASGGLSVSYCEGMTPSYCSPEQYEAFLAFQKSDRTQAESSAESSTAVERITRQSDIWSWAISVLAMFHGRSPCKKGGQTASEVFEIFLKIPTAAGRCALPEPLIELLRCCFRRNPQERPESMGEIADRLTKIYAQTVGESYPRPKPVNAAFTAESFCNRAISMLDLGKPVEAYQLITQAANMSFWHPQITFNKTLMAWRYGLISDIQALHQAEELTKYNGRDANSFYALGLLQRERANPKGAVQALERAMELDDSRPEIRKALDRCRSMVSREACCCGRFVLSSLGAASSSRIFVNRRQNLFIMPVSGGHYALQSALTGQTILGFKSSASTDGRQNLIGLSDDYRRELLRGAEGSLTIRAVDSSTEVSGSGGETLERLETLTEVAWGRKQDAFDAHKTIRLSIRENIVDLFHADDGKFILSLSGHEREVTALYVTPDGKWAASGSFDASLRIWNLETGRCIRTFRGLAGSIDAIWIDEAHRYVLTLIHGTSLQLWNIDLLCNRRELTRAPVMICVVSSSEEIARRQTELGFFVMKARNAISMCDYRTAVEAIDEARKIDGWQAVRADLNLSDMLGRHAETVELDEIVSGATLSAHDEAISSVALSFDGQTAVSAGNDYVVRLWRLPHFEAVREMAGHVDWIRSIDMTIDGRVAVSGSWDRSVRLWDLHNGRLIRPLSGEIRNISKIRLAPDGRTIAVATGSGELSLWDGASGERVCSIPTDDGSINALRFSRDGRYLLAGGENRVLTIYDLATLAPVCQLSGFKKELRAIDLSVDFRWVVGADEGGEILLFDLLSESRRPMGVFSGHLGAVTGLRILPDNKRVVSSSRDKTVRIWNMAECRQLRSLEHLSAVNDFVFDIGQSELLSGDERGNLRLWNLFWRYRYPGSAIDEEATTRMLRVVTGYYLRQLDIYSRKKKPEIYYGAGSSEFSPSDVTLDEKTVLKILTEMSYRGYGAISKRDMFDRLGRVIDRWEGLLKIE